MTPDECLEECAVPGQKSVFFLGVLEHRVTLLSQQIRALNLVDALLERRLIRNTGSVAIIGGGVAGVTAAAAFAAAAPNLKKIDIYERKEDVLHLQKRSDRYLHPHLYDWPAPGSDTPDAGLPLLTWSAGPAGVVADTIERQFEHFRNISSINLKTGRDVSEVIPFPLGGCRIIVNGAPRDGDTYDIAILSVGFGYESFIGEHTHSYWDPSALVGAIRDRADEHLIFVSGNGDGGLVDLQMAAFAGLPHMALCEFIAGRQDIEHIKSLLLEIEKEAWSATGPYDIFGEYRSRIVPQIPSSMLLDVQDRLRKRATVWFHTRETEIFRRETSVLNRFGAILVFAADENAGLNKLHFVCGKDFLGAVPSSGAVSIDGVPPFVPFRRFLRFGTDKKTCLAPFDKLVEPYRSRQEARRAAAGGFRPATPILSASAQIRFEHASASVEEIEPAPAVVRALESTGGELRIEIDRQPDGRFVWCGDIQPEDIDRVWAEETVGVELICHAVVRDAGCLVAALARIVAHAPSVNFYCKDRGRWEEALRGFGGRSLPGANVDVRFSVLANNLEPMIMAAGSTNHEAEVLASTIHSRLDLALLSSLQDNLFRCLRQQVPIDIGWVMEPDLRHRMWSVWEVWYSELTVSEEKRRRFLSLLLTEKDDNPVSEGVLVSVGPKCMRPHLLRAAVFALAFAVCSSVPLETSNAYPGNFRMDLTTAHVAGFSWINGREIGPEVAAQRWTTGLVLLSELRTGSAILNNHQSRLDQIPGDPTRLSDLGLAEAPIIIGCDPTFQQALEDGAAAVSVRISAYFSDRAQDLEGTLES
jgi:hypothetical protein